MTEKASVSRRGLLFRCASTVQLSGVDAGHAEVEAAPKRSDRGVSIGVLDEPNALADPRNKAPRGPEQTLFHGGLSAAGDA